MRFYLLIAIFAAILFMAIGCSKAAGISKSTAGNADQALSAGIQNYEDGDYKTATKNLKRALDMGLAYKSDVVQAHKYLAFIYCVSGKEKKCRNEFRKALDKDKKFELKPEESGHPLWGPAFRDVKAQGKK